MTMETILIDLNPKVNGDYVLFDCPWCHRAGRKQSGWIHRESGRTIRCQHKNSCGYTESLWDYLLRKYNDNKGAAYRALKKIA